MFDFKSALRMKVVGGLFALALALTAGLQLQNAWAATSAATGQTCTIVGTDKSETLVGTAKNDVICGLGGNDIINGAAGNDVLDGGTGNDKLIGGTGNDTLIGGTGTDSFDGGTGTNRCAWLSGDKSKTACTTFKVASPVATPTASASASATPKPSSTPTSTSTSSATPSPTPTTTVGLLINFENSMAGTTSVDFGGESSSITTSGLPVGGSANNYTALKTTKGNVSWSGVTFFAQNSTALITSTYKTISANVWSSAAGKNIRLKVENHSDINLAVETDAVTTTSGWQRLTWNFASNAAGTPAFNAAVVYDKLSVFPEFGSTTAGSVFWIDDVALLGATPPALGAPAPTPTQSATPPPSNGTKVLLWSQEFNGAANANPDSSAWAPDLGDGSIFNNPGWGNNELQYYTNDSAKLDGAGNLNITATKTSTGYACYIGTCYWKSAKLTTKQKVGFKFGYLEARLKTPVGAGMWPAFWMLGANINENGGSVYWPHTGEIDIFEGKGSAPNTVWGTPHNVNIHSGATTNSPTPLSADYHTYAINWSQDRIEWLFDGTVFHTLRATDAGAQPYPFNLEFYLILNLAVGGAFGGPVDASLSSGTLSIDYVRFYSNDGVGQLLTH